MTTVPVAGMVAEVEGEGFPVVLVAAFESIAPQRKRTA